MELSDPCPQTSGRRGGACPRPGEAKPRRFSRKSGEQAQSLLQIIYNQWFVGISKRRVRPGLAAEPEDAHRLGLLRLLFFLHVSCELFVAVPWNAIGKPVLAAEAGSFTGLWVGLGVLACLVWERLGSRPEFARLLAWMLAITALIWLFPNLPNHLFLVVFCLTILQLVDLGDDRESVLGLWALRWVAVVVFAATGFQKLRYGTYFHGEFMTWAIVHTERFAAFFQAILPAEEWQRLRALPREGPFGTSWWPLVVISNSVWIFELSAPIFLFFQRTRGPATAAIIAFLFCIEVGAREWMFGCIFVSLMLLFPKRNFLPRAVPIYVLIYLSIFASRIPPQFGFGNWGFLPL